MQIEPSPVAPLERKSPAVAMVWSIALAGLGQFYNGQPQKGGIFLVAAFACWFIFWPLWIGVAFWSIHDAYCCAEEINQKIATQQDVEAVQEEQEVHVRATRTKVADFVKQAEKLNGIYKAKVFGEGEYHKKLFALIATLEEKRPYEDPDDFLTALIPLVNSGVFNTDEISAIKSHLYVEAVGN